MARGRFASTGGGGRRKKSGPTTKTGQVRAENTARDKKLFDMGELVGTGSRMRTLVEAKYSGARATKAELRLVET